MEFDDDDDNTAIEQRWTVLSLVSFWLTHHHNGGSTHPECLADWIKEHVKRGRVLQEMD